MTIFSDFRWAYKLCTAVAVLCMMQLVIANHNFADESQIDAPTTCGEYGTTIEFVDSPAEAAKQALAAEKLVFVLHVSGNFETPEYT